MKEVVKENKSLGKKVFDVRFNTIDEFYNYITSTPLNKVFEWGKLSSVENDEKFSKTKSFEEAVDLLTNGCDDISKKLTNQLNMKVNLQSGTKNKNVYDVQGFQCCVPLYLQGVPTSMIARKSIPVKQKVITIVKSIDYLANVTADEIIEQSIKALEIIKKIESQGVRCNLDILVGLRVVANQDNAVCLRVRVKKSTEKLNISKLAFTMVHPSMLRRLVFRFIEVYPNITSGYKRGYGRLIDDKYIRESIIDKKQNEYYLPSFINVDINSVNDLEAIR